MYEVIVGYLGAVYSGNDKNRAMRAFRRYVEWSLKSQVSSVGVVLFHDGVVVKEHDMSLVRFAIQVS